MKHKFPKSVIATVTALAVILNFLPVPVQATGRLVKTENSSTVYYLDAQNIRHPFSTRATYESWYGNDFSQVETISDRLMASFILGDNITVRPGKLVKVPSQPAVYAVEEGGLLRELGSETVAQSIYGSNWHERVIDVPEVFFQDYVIGTPITKVGEIPDNVLYYLPSEDTYYYKRSGALQPFANTSAITANNLKIQEAVVSNKLFSIRSTEITSQSEQVFDPVAPVVMRRGDCRNTDLRVATIFLTQYNANDAGVRKAQAAMSVLPKSFATATNNLSSLSTDAVVTQPLTQGLYTERADGSIEINNEVINVFYDTHADVYDFIFIWTDFRGVSNQADELAYFIPVSNWQKGNGRELLDRSGVYGSAGRLKGIIMMGLHEKYTIDSVDGMNKTQEVLLHELLHQWSAYMLAPGIGSEQILLREPDKQHWSSYTTFISPLGGSGWIQAAPGVFESQIATAQKPRPYSLLDLYAMGLVPIQFMQDVSVVIPTKPQTSENSITGYELVISPELLVESNGPIICAAPNR